jgi:pimeloyl-ACP methyl ester carboxylesterase
MAELRRTQIEVDGIRAPIIEAGPNASKEAVFFIHGNPGSSEDWARLAAAVGDVARAVAVDMPGFGQADKPREFQYEVASYATFVEGAMRELGIERAHLVLHDFGGPFGLVWAIQHPDRLASVTLINTGILLGYKWHRMARIWRAPVVGELAQALVTEGAWNRNFGKSGVPQEDVTRMYRDYDKATRRAVLKLYRATNNPGDVAGELSKQFRQLDKPALVVWGAQDPFIGVEHAEQQRESFPSAKVTVLDRSGHWPFLDDPDGVAAEVVPFVREQLGQREGAAPAL